MLLVVLGLSQIKFGKLISECDLTFYYGVIKIITVDKAKIFVDQH